MRRERIQRIGIHIILWLTYAIVMYNWVSSAWMDYVQSLWLTLRIIGVHALIFYINVYVLLPKLMEKNRYILYLLSIISLLIAIYFFREFIHHFFPIDPPERFQGLRDMPPPRPDHRPDKFVRTFRISPRVIMDNISSVAVLFISTTFWLTMQTRKRQEAEADIKNENLNTELKLLKSQINPHFLFNALNNIYSMSFTSQEKAPDMIMKLSDMLRYVLYESNENKVSLDKEIEYIHNFIDFQKLKIEGEANIDLNIKVTNTALPVEPMLFIPFIENSFKHSNLESDNGWLKITLISKEEQILFSISNSRPVQNYSKDKTSGIGLENVKKRLELLYPNKHELIIEEEADSFTVNLTIEV
ncbi:histidine kinase [Fulvivirga maritima]|uniref:sensor histidine kinase n=1 Tax=Fulvivirga maritima TaxID=2904247 RepID=UPI001F1B5F0F|nr:histidine kinase [Fulvivirga maritima]UII25491.1 histidine kinase [Fulvivirga maritima]